MMFPVDPRLVQAARNNAHWCDTVCRSHGNFGTFLDAIWFTRQATPRFHPNAVTLVPEGVAMQLESIDAVEAAGFGGLELACAEVPY
jgi:hypothetical protein